MCLGLTTMKLRMLVTGQNWRSANFIQLFSLFAVACGPAADDAKLTDGSGGPPLAMKQAAVCPEIPDSKCFGAVGSNCDGVGSWPFGLAPCSLVGDGVHIDCQVSVGSQMHDTCCMQNPTTGKCCHGDCPNLWELLPFCDDDSDPCCIEWKHAFNDTASGFAGGVRQWTKRFELDHVAECGTVLAYTTPDDSSYPTESSFYPPTDGTTKIWWLDAQWGWCLDYHELYYIKTYDRAVQCGGQSPTCLNGDKRCASSPNRVETCVDNLWFTDIWDECTGDEPEYKSECIGTHLESQCACSIGARRCSLNWVLICQEYTPTWRDWAYGELCGDTESTVCSDGYCVQCGDYNDQCCYGGTCNNGLTCEGAICLCSDDCSAGEKKCSNSIQFKECGSFDSDPCLDWGPAQTCGTNEFCDGAGICIPCGGYNQQCCPEQLFCGAGLVCNHNTGTCICSGECSSGERVCFNETQFQECINPNGDLCWEWGALQSCGAATICWWETGNCISCGGAWQPCCAGASCNQSYLCSGEICLPDPTACTAQQCFVPVCGVP